MPEPTGPQRGGTVSEGGSGDLAEGATESGADSVPDTPDTNEGGQGAAIDEPDLGTNEQAE